VLGLLTSLSVGMVLTFEMVLANERRSLDRELLEQRDRFERDVRDRIRDAPRGLERQDQVRWAMLEFLALEPDTTEVTTVMWSGSERLGATASSAELDELIAGGRFDLLSIGRLATVHTAVGDLRALRVDVLDGPAAVGSFAVAGPLAPARGEAFEALRRLALAAVVSLLVGWFVVEVAVRRVLRPLQRLTSAAASTEMHAFAGSVAVEGDDEVADLTREFNAMLVRLDDASAERERLLATISHELRTPLAVARAKLELAELAQAGLGPVPVRPDDTGRGEESDRRAATDDVRGSLAIAREELERMSRLVGDLLALGRSGHREFIHRRDVDLRDLVRDLEVRLDGLGFDTVTVSPAPAVIVSADAERLLQAVLNCVQNSIVHNPEGTTVDVRISLLSDRLVIRVIDDGSGIAVDDRERVMLPFVSLDTSNQRAQQATGLGLAVVAAIARGHGGVVRVLDAPADLDGHDHERRAPEIHGTMIEISFPVDAVTSPV
jgi:two-component system, OmpR family, sensor kinase